MAAERTAMTRINTSPLVKTYTLEEFWQLPDPPDRSKLELIAGVVYMSPPPPETHDDIVSRLNLLLVRHLDSTGDKGRLYAPRAAVWTSKRTYLEPDLFYISAELMISPRWKVWPSSKPSPVCRRTSTASVVSSMSHSSRTPSAP